MSSSVNACRTHTGSVIGSSFCHRGVYPLVNDDALIARDNELSNSDNLRHSCLPRPHETEFEVTDRLWEDEDHPRCLRREWRIGPVWVHSTAPPMPGTTWRRASGMREVSVAPLSGEWVVSCSPYQTSTGTVIVARSNSHRPMASTVSRA